MAPEGVTFNPPYVDFKDASLAEEAQNIFALKFSEHQFQAKNHRFGHYLDKAGQIIAQRPRGIRTGLFANFESPFSLTWQGFGLCWRDPEPRASRPFFGGNGVQAEHRTEGV